MAPRRSTDDADDKIIREAKKRFKKCADWESTWRSRFVEDIKFVNADARNLYQWSAEIQKARGMGTADERPCPTINKTRQHCLQIVNDGRQNKTSIKIKPVGDGATYEAAQVFEGIVRHIEYISNAQAVYTNASKFQVQGGIGYCRVVTEYADNDTFDQEIFIREINDPLSVYLDPDYKEADGSDCRFGFIFADVDREAFEAQYPDVKLASTSSVLGNDENAWVGKDKIRVAEYYYRTEVPDELVVFVNPQSGDKMPVKRSDLKGMSGDLLDAFNEQLKDPATKRRPIKSHEVKWVKIAGNEIIERSNWDGDTIPIVFAMGERTVIDGELDIKGHARALIDPQNMYNYNAAASIEYGALQGKSPYLAPMAAIGDLGEYWGRQNLDNMAWLPWNHLDDAGNPIPPPVRQNPPIGAPLYQQGMENAANDMMLVSGQYQPMMGEPSNERSGKAIQARQRQGENSTYHFIDNLAMMVRRLGKIIVQLAPKVYDTPRTLKILGEDGTDSDVFLDPDAKQAFQKRQAQDTETDEQIIMNPTLGRYDVMSDPGPDFATRRQEAFNALSQIAAQNPELMSVIGDLVMLAADFPLADEAAERLKRMVPPQALGDTPDPQVAALQQKLDATQNLLGSMSAKLQSFQGRSDRGDEQKSVDIFKAVTARLDVLMKYSQIPARDLMAFQHDLAMQEHAGNLDLAGKMVDSSLTDDGAEQEQAA